MLVLLGDGMSQKLNPNFERTAGQSGEVAMAAVRVERPSAERANERPGCVTQVIESSDADPHAGRCGRGASSHGLHAPMVILRGLLWI